MPANQARPERAGAGRLYQPDINGAAEARPIKAEVGQNTRSPPGPRSWGAHSALRPHGSAPLRCESIVRQALFSRKSWPGPAGRPSPPFGIRAHARLRMGRRGSPRTPVSFACRQIAPPRRRLFLGTPTSPRSAPPFRHWPAHKWGASLTPGPAGRGAPSGRARRAERSGSRRLTAAASAGQLGSWRRGRPRRWRRLRTYRRPAWSCRSSGCRRSDKCATWC